MVEAIGGRIWVESEGTDRGSIFFIEVPKEHVEEN
jgi:signal transduction histidine kinase